MAFVVGELSAPITADTKGFDKDLNRIKKTGEQTARNLSARFRQVGQSISNAGSIATRFVTGPMLAVGAGVMILANRTANYADEIDKMSIRTGLARDTLQELRFAADQTGVSFDGIQGVIESFTRQIPMIEQGTSESARSFKKLNIDIKDGQGNLRSMSELFPAVIRRLASMQNITERNAIATQVFGRRAFEIVPLLDAGEKGIEQFTKRAHELGLVMSDEAIKTAVDYKDEMSALKQEFGAVGRELAVKLMPVIKDDLIPVVRDQIIPMFKTFVEWVAKTIKHFGELDEGTQKLVLSMGGLALVGGPALKIIGTLIKLLAGIKAIIAAPIAGVLALAGGIGAVGFAADRDQKKLGKLTDAQKRLNEATAKQDIEGLIKLQDELHLQYKKNEDRLKHLTNSTRQMGVAAVDNTTAIDRMKANQAEVEKQMATVANTIKFLTGMIQEDTVATNENTDAKINNFQTVETLTENLQRLKNERDAILDINRELTASEYAQARALQMQADALERARELRERMIQPVKELNTAEQSYKTIISGIPTVLEPVRIATEKMTETIKGMTHAEYESLKFSMMRADEMIRSAKDVANAMIAEARRVIQAQFAIGMSGVLADAGIKLGILAPIVGAGMAAAFSAFWNRFIPKLATGGIIPPGFPNDSFPAMLSSGEAVIPLDRHNDFIGNKEINLNIRLTGDVRARDNELAYIINQVIKKRARLT
jgi:hypothetical protein